MTWQKRNQYQFPNLTATRRTSMTTAWESSRRRFLQQIGWWGCGLSLSGGLSESRGSTSGPGQLWESVEWIKAITDPEIRSGVETAITRNLLPAASERQYPGHFSITADGAAFGADTTWPGLDSWQMAGAYLHLGRQQLVLDYFEFVRAAQRRDGHIPFAIFPGSTKSDGKWLRGLRNPEDVFTYQPPQREGAAESSQQTKQWVGLFEHWQPKANPLSVLGPVCYLLTAMEIFEQTQSATWLQARIASLTAAAQYLADHAGDNGLISGSGFYMEMPPRFGWDGITQCYVVHAWRALSRLCGSAGDGDGQLKWEQLANRLRDRFADMFWRDDHFAEYVHQERGVVDAHGLSDVNWAAVAFGLADHGQIARLWPRLMKEDGFWVGKMPTQIVTRPFSYEAWELHEPLPFPTTSPLNDIAAMGRVWYLEALACRQQAAHERLLTSLRHVCRAASAEGYWRERYHPRPDGSVVPAGAEKYCEYPAVLVRIAFACRACLGDGT